MIAFEERKSYEPSVAGKCLHFPMTEAMMIALEERKSYEPGVAKNACGTPKPIPAKAEEAFRRADRHAAPWGQGL